MKPQETAAAPLTPEGVVELVNQERIPLLSRGAHGNERGMVEHIMAFIPPEGTKFGDTMEGRPAIGYTFKSPEGEVRGAAALQFLPLKEGLEVRRRLEEALRERGIDNSSKTSYAFRRARRWVFENIGI